MTKTEWEKGELPLFGKYDWYFDVVCATVIILSAAYFIYHLFRI